ncbi:27014_t:CDS:2, partial [Dentiscutata erythropus]
NLWYNNIFDSSKSQCTVIPCLDNDNDKIFQSTFEQQHLQQQQSQPPQHLQHQPQQQQQQRLSQQPSQQSQPQQLSRLSQLSQLSHLQIVSRMVQEALPNFPIIIPTSKTIEELVTCISQRSRPGKPPRPQNRFLLYRKNLSANLHNQLLGLGVKGISSLAAQLWNDESREVKEFYNRLADLAKRIHKKVYPYYKFTPKNVKRKSATNNKKKSNDPKSLSPN